MSPEKTQDQPEATHPVYHVTAAGIGAEVSAEAVPVDRGARRVLQLAKPDGDAGKNLVPEPAREGQEAAGGRAREAEDGRQAHATSGHFRDFFSAWGALARALRRSRCTRVSETFRARFTRRTVRSSAHRIRHVSLSMRRLRNCPFSPRDLEAQ